MAKGIRVRRVVRRFELWSVAKVAFAFHLICWGLTLVFATALWRILLSVGSIDGLERFLRSNGFDEGFTIDGGVLFQALVVGGAVLVVVNTVATVLLAFVYNRISALFGGVVVSVLEEPGVVPAAAPAAGVAPAGPRRRPVPPPGAPARRPSPSPSPAPAAQTAPSGGARRRGARAPEPAPAPAGTAAARPALARPAPPPPVVEPDWGPDVDGWLPADRVATDWSGSVAPASAPVGAQAVRADQPPPARSSRPRPSSVRRPPVAETETTAAPAPAVPVAPAVNAMAVTPEANGVRPDARAGEGERRVV